MLAFGFILLAACLVFGSALVLLRTAKQPKVPKGFKPSVDDDEETGGW